MTNSIQSGNGERTGTAHPGAALASCLDWGGPMELKEVQYQSCPYYELRKKHINEVSCKAYGL